MTDVWVFVFWSPVADLGLLLTCDSWINESAWFFRGLTSVKKSHKTFILGVTT